MHKRRRGRGNGSPDWLNEGLAEYGNIEPGFSYDLAVLRAVRTDTLYPLVQLANRPGEPDAVIVFYGHSRQVVDFMIRTFGAAKMSELLREFREGQLNFDDTLEKVYGIDLITLDNMWRESIGVPPVPMERIGNRPDSTTPTPIPTRAPLGAPTATPSPDSTGEIEIENGDWRWEQLRQAYGTIPGDPGFDATADLTMTTWSTTWTWRSSVCSYPPREQREMKNIAKISLAAAILGALVVLILVSGCGGGDDDAVVVTLTPSSIDAEPGGSFTVDVEVDPKGQELARRK